MGLPWDGVDFGTGTLRVSQSLQRIDKAFQLVEPKTARSRRTLALPAIAAAALRAHRTR